MTLSERFMAKVDTTNECWHWTASKYPTGYGMFRVGQRVTYAHRVAYELYVGDTYPGSGNVARAWDRWQQQPTLPIARGANAEGRASRRATAKALLEHPTLPETLPGLRQVNVYDAINEAIEAA